MSDADHELGSQSRKQLAEHIERLESLSEEKKLVGEKIKAEFADLASSGYDKLAVKQIIKDRAADASESVELRAVTAVYRRALGSLSDTPLGQWARSWMSEEARINKPTKAETSPQMDDFMKGRKGQKAAPPDGDAAQA